MPTTPLSKDPLTNALLSTYQWGAQNGRSALVTYSFPADGSKWVSDYGPEVTAGWFGLNSVQQGHFREALASWAEVANVNFSLVSDYANPSGQIRVAFSNAVKNTGFAGWAYYPTATTSPQAGDIWLNPDDNYFYPGTLNFSTLQHEIGHALGLKHPFEAEGGNTAVLADAENSSQYTMMSYTDYDGAGYIYLPTGGGRYWYYAVLPSTPMLYDVAAVQFLYGANMSTRTGNDVYRFSSSEGVLKTIWDAGGVDTFDLSNQTVDQVINLNAGQFSSLGVRKTSYDGPLLAAKDNVAIAYQVNIEKAIGGFGDDKILGNGNNNSLKGRGGDDEINGASGRDWLYGNNGNDTLVGGSGNDKLDGGAGIDVLMGGAGNDSYVVNLSRDAVIEAVKAGYDTVQSKVSWVLPKNVEKLVLQGKKPLDGTGNTLNNTLIGNAADNQITGKWGNDKLVGGGGSDTLTGGGGRDKFLFDNLKGVDKITDFSVAEDTILLEQTVFAAIKQTGTLATNQFVNGSAAVDGDDYLIYRQNNGALYYDADGNGVGAQVPIALLGSHLALTHADFVVV